MKSRRSRLIRGTIQASATAGKGGCPGVGVSFADLALWWQYLQVFGLSWDAVTLEAVGGFLAWLRTGDGPRVVSIEQRPARFAESTIAARLQAVVSCYRYHQFNGVELGRDLVRLVHSRGGSYKPMLEHAARRARRRQAVIRVRRPEGLHRRC